MAKDAGGHGSEARGGSSGLGDPAKPFNALTNSIGHAAGPAHQAGVAEVGKLPPESATSRELRLYADNSADLNRQSTQPIRDNLGKKMDKGTYDPALATKLWGYHADRAAQAYTKEFGGSGNKGFGSFSPTHRREAAANWERDERSDIKSGSSRTAKVGRTPSDRGWSGAADKQRP